MKPQKPKEYLGVREIAKLAHVSPSTVSRVINYPERTSDEVRERVNRIIEQYHYVPNQMAKNLFSRSSNSIAVFIHDMTNPFYALLLQELGQLSFAEKYNMIICNTMHDRNQETEYLNYCQSVRTKGIISIDNFPSADIYQKLHHSTKLVSFDGKVDSIYYSSVTSNHQMGIELLLNHLAELGHRKIAYASSGNLLHAARLRREAYCQFIGQHHDFSFREDYIHEFEATIRAGKEIFHYFMNLPDPPTAILCGNDSMAIGLLMCAQHHGLRVPDDLSIAGFDGLTEGFSYPNLTTVLQDYKQISKVLFDDIVDPTRFETVHHDVLDVFLSVGQTTGPINRRRPFPKIV